MEEQLAHVLAETQSPIEGPRQAAEQQLLSLYANEQFPSGLAAIAAHDSVASNIRQAALLSLKQYVLATWSPEFEDTFTGHQTILSQDAKAQLRAQLLNLATSDNTERKVQNAACYVVSKIASADFPDDWPGLLPTLLELVPQASDARLHGALKVLYELVEQGFDEQQFFAVAQDLINVLQLVAFDEQRKPVLRALALAGFRSCFDTLEVVMEEHKVAVKQFAEQTLAHWMPFFLEVIKVRLPTIPSDDAAGTADNWRGLVAFKVQAVRILIKIRTLFPAILAPQSPALFSAIWDELLALQPDYQATYIDDDAGEGRMEDSDGLPYTLDFLVLEDLDLMQACIRAPPVRKELEKQIQEQSSNWVVEVMKLAATYAQITTEEEGMWEIDVNVFLAEETSVTTNYTARIACGDLIIKISEWLPQPTLSGLLSHAQALFGASQSWRLQEGVLFILNQILNDWQDVSRPVDPQTAAAFTGFAQHAQQQSEHFLRARGVIVSASLLRAAPEALGPQASTMLQQTLRSIHEDKSEVVQVSCIRALQHYLQALPSAQTLPMQELIVQSLQTWVRGRDMSALEDSDDLLITLVETLRDVIMLDPRLCINGDGLNILFSVASAVPTNIQMFMLVSETFEEIAEAIAKLGGEAYAQLCQRTLPSLLGAFDVGDLTEESALTGLAAELLSELTRFAPGGLPAGFVTTVMPKLNRVLLAATDEELLRACTSTLKYVVQHDSKQMFEWQDEQGKGGLESVLVIIDRLLGPSIDDNAAAEIGGLASEVVTQAGSEQLGPYLMQLLQAVAQRVAIAEQTQVVQSLIGVFARLALNNAKDVVDFLTQLQIGADSGLSAVMHKWLEGSNLFVGYEDIRQNVIALSKLYALHDERLQQVQVKGDLIVPTSDRIITRSQRKANPDQYTMVPAPLKIVKLLVDELSAASGGRAGALDGAGTAEAVADAEDGDDDDDEDGEWEDEPSAFDSFGGLGASRAELLAYAEESPLSTRQHDDQTQDYLREWFTQVGSEPGFDQVFAALTEAEQEKLRRLG